MLVNSLKRAIRTLLPPELRRRLRGAVGAPRDPAERRSRTWAAPGSFGALVAERRSWLDRHLPPAAAEYHYDIFTKGSQKRIAKRLGLEVAADYALAVPLAEALDVAASARLERFVVKPDSAHSALGCRRLVRADDGYREIGTGTRYRRSELERELRKEVAHLGRPDAWVLEELLVPADGSLVAFDDYKFYCFGGRAELILHKWPAANGIGTQRNWYTRDWSEVTVSTRGPNEGVTRAPVSGARLLAAAEAASSRLCYPFLRVDLYDTSRGVVFGEFTPGPGKIEAFTETWSERLRERWLEAERDVLERIRTGAVVPLAREIAPLERPVAGGGEPLRVES